MSTPNREEERSPVDQDGIKKPQFTGTEPAQGKSWAKRSPQFAPSGLDHQLGSMSPQAERSPNRSRGGYAWHGGREHRREQGYIRDRKQAGRYRPYNRSLGISYPYGPRKFLSRVPYMNIPSKHHNLGNISQSFNFNPAYPALNNMCYMLKPHNIQQGHFITEHNKGVLQSIPGRDIFIDPSRLSDIQKQTGVDIRAFIQNIPSLQGTDVWNWRNRHRGNYSGTSEYKSRSYKFNQRLGMQSTDHHNRGFEGETRGKDQKVSENTQSNQQSFTREPFIGSPDRSPANHGDYSIDHDSDGQLKKWDSANGASLQH